MGAPANSLTDSCVAPVLGVKTKMSDGCVSFSQFSGPRFYKYRFTLELWNKAELLLVFVMMPVASKSPLLAVLAAVLVNCVIFDIYFSFLT